ncbi:homeodomain transcription factor ste12 [Scheffersomyces spartinae]|uniref:Homeodomain transcription factor ste12 n=1 Tax=Scheffersomyces spartinae TaxID=45513 RepID=A0A9P7VDI5_9ASCO|nr:homeodomain transcription factor ste12 [Scheffersomyces spartinae]KAG7195324.1 homeodomain transcription factor ste12 [Scheffersomyces spartinae]
MVDSTGGEKPITQRSGSSPDILESLRLIEDLKFFLATAPANWHENQVIRRYYLNHDEGFVLCVFWNNLYFITGTDIVRCIVYKFEHFGRKIIDRKKFEEGIFSDLRNLKIGTDAILEAPRSEFLEFLFKNSCLRTQKKQKVFFWFNVPHDKLTADALDRDLKKEKLGQKATTVAVNEPALLFSYDEDKPFLNQLEEHLKAQNAKYKRDIQTPATVTISNGGGPPSNTTNMSMPLISDKSSSYSGIPNNNSHYNHNNNNNHNHHNNKPYALAKGPVSEFNNTTNNNNSENYEFLGQETPAHFKQSDEDEDDFPLDYFQNPTNNDDYIQFDPNFQYSIYPTGIPDDKPIDFVVDPSILFNGSTTPTTKLVFNEEYLIEQTVPLKAPPLPPTIDAGGGPMYMQPPPTAGIVGPQLAYHPPPSASKYSYYFPYSSDYPQYPVSAKYQTSFPKYSTLLQPSQQQQSATGASTSSYPQDTHVKHEYEPLTKRKFHQQDQRNDPQGLYPEQEVWPMAVPVTPMYPPSAYPSHGADPYLSVPMNQPYLVYDGDYHNPYMVSSPMTKYVPQSANSGYRSGQPGGLQSQEPGNGQKKNRTVQSQSQSQLLSVPTAKRQQSRSIGSGGGAIMKKSETTRSSSSFGKLEKKAMALEDVVQSKIAKTRNQAANAASSSIANDTNNELMIATPDSSASDTKLK